MIERSSAESGVRITEYARRTYFPADDRRGVALCLSGGGFRAALFHLGAARRLYELGVLQQVDAITAVSGGSVIAAHLAEHCDLWRHEPPSRDRWETAIAAPFREFTSKNLANWPMLKGWLRPWTNAGLEALADACIARKLATLQLKDLPETPQFMFNVTDLVTGEQRVAARGSELKWSVATAVAVSSCFPVVFRPYMQSEPERMVLMDGGISDNRALEPVWKGYRTLLVSDGGDVVRPQWGESILWPLYRTAAVLFGHAQVVQRRWLLANFKAETLEGAYWGIESAASHYVEDRRWTSYPGYSPALARDIIAPIRTTYDAFSPPEAAVLENHGYLLAEAAMRTHPPRHVSIEPAPLSVPHPAWMGEPQVREALRHSATYRFFGRW